MMSKPVPVVSITVLFYYFAGYGIEAKDGIAQKDRAGDDHGHLEPGPEPQPREGQAPGHVTRSLERSQDAGAAADRLLLEEPRDGQDDEHAHEAVAALVNDAEEERKPDVADRHQDEAGSREDHAQQEEAPVAPWVILQPGDEERGQGEGHVGPGHIERDARVAQAEAGPEKWAVDGQLGAPVEGEKDQKCREEERPLVEDRELVFPDGHRRELLFPKAGRGQSGQG